MRILIIAATESEIQPFLNSEIQKLHAIETLITGVGMVATSYSLAKALSKGSYQLLLNVGIGGSFHRDISLGTVLRVKEDCFSELGAQNDEEFLTLKDLNFGEFCFQENCGELLHLPSVRSLKAVNGITVNKVHGQEKSIKMSGTDLITDVYPVALKGTDFVLVFSTVFGISAIASFISSRLSLRSNEQLS